MFRHTRQLALNGFAFASLIAGTAFAGGNCGGYAAPIYGGGYGYRAPSCHASPAFGFKQNDPLFGLPKAVIGQQLALPGFFGRPSNAFLLVNGKFHPCQITASPNGGLLASIPDCGISSPTLGQLLFTDANGRLMNQLELNVNPATPAPAAAPAIPPGQPGAPAAAPAPTSAPVPAAAPGLLTDAAASATAIPPAAPPADANAAVTQAAPNISEPVNATAAN